MKKDSRPKSSVMQPALSGWGGLALAAGMCIALAPAAARAESCCQWPGTMGDGSLSLSSEERPWNAGIKYSFTSLDGFQEGTRTVSLDEARSRYAMIPLKMTTQRMDLSAAYTAFGGFLTFQAIVPYLIHSMDMSMDMSGFGAGSPSTPAAPAASPAHVHGGLQYAGSSWMDHSMDSVSGLGDITLMMSGPLLQAGTVEDGRQALVLGAGVKTPTGSATQKDVFGTFLEPCMQLGTGSWDPLVRLEYRFSLTDWTLRANGSYQYATRNPEGYKYGDTAVLGGDASYAVVKCLRLNAGLSFRSDGQASDADGKYSNPVSMTGDPANTGGKGVWLTTGLEIAPAEWAAIQGAIRWPLWSDLNGIQEQPGPFYSIGGAVSF